MLVVPLAGTRSPAAKSRNSSRPSRRGAAAERGSVSTPHRQLSLEGATALAAYVRASEAAREATESAMMRKPRRMRMRSVRGPRGR